VNYILKSLSINNSLTNLNVASNFISDGGVKNFFEYLNNNTALVNIDFSCIYLFNFRE
jgi:Ran GTPase-activating protein (RanGAP) involved in mRNA processing and transport